MKLKKIMFIIFISIFILSSMSIFSFANDSDFGWIKAYYSEKYSISENYTILNYNFDENKNVVKVRVNKDGLTYLDQGIYDQENLTITNLQWVNAYFSQKYPISENYIIQTYSYDDETKEVKIQVSKGNRTFLDKVKSSINIDGDWFIIKK